MRKFWRSKPNCSKRIRKENLECARRSVWVNGTLMTSCVCENELVIAVAEFRKLQNLQPAPENFTRDMEDQLKMMHQVYNVVDRPHRKIYVTMLRYKVDNPDSTYVQIRLFGKMQKDGNFVQITYVNYKQQEFLHLLDIMDYSYAQIINNKRVSIDM